MEGAPEPRIFFDHHFLMMSESARCHEARLAIDQQLNLLWATRDCYHIWLIFFHTYFNREAMLLLTVFCIFSVLSLTSATQSFKHIKSLINEVESLPVVHQHDLWGFVETYLEPGTGRDRRRVYEESHPDGFFHLKSVVSLNDEVESHFVMKPVVFRPDVHENGKPVRVDLGHTFNGYSSDDIGTIIVLHVPSSSQVEGGSHPMEAVSGMVHHSNGKLRISRSRIFRVACLFCLKL